MISLWFDGSCGPVNPGGTAGIGVIIKEDGKTVYENSEVVGEGPLMSNNVAEYAALIDGLEYLVASGRKDKPIVVHGDSLMVIRQMKGELQIHRKSRGLYVPYGRRCLEMRSQFSDIRYVWIPREENTLADALSTPSTYKELENELDVQYKDFCLTFLK
jgi:ribonuclease HI